MIEKVIKEKKFLLKDILFTREKVERLAYEIFSVYAPFDKESFVEAVVEKFPELELKQRIVHITVMLHEYLEALAILVQALPPELDTTRTDGDYGDFVYASYAEYVARYGLEKKYIKESLYALEEITKRFSAEFAIREFWNTHEESVYVYFLQWSKSNNYHVRRLASEGSRPRLPWGKNIQLDYKKTEQFLDILFSDRTRYVTRSVANHLNDISKFDPDFVLRKLSQWEASNKQHKKEMDFIKKHATRTLRKRNKSQV
ncbi:MAG: hypothetical protein RLZZ308_199 [Candidatus Parcubacteria bacterium]|jgi:3-methyladenine DNA glycosylase AlkC